MDPEDIRQSGHRRHLGLLPSSPRTLIPTLLGSTHSHSWSASSVYCSLEVGLKTPPGQHPGCDSRAVHSTGVSMIFFCAYPTPGTMCSENHHPGIPGKPVQASLSFQPTLLFWVRSFINLAPLNFKLVTSVFLQVNFNLNIHANVLSFRILERGKSELLSKAFVVLNIRQESNNLF